MYHALSAPFPGQPAYSSGKVTWNSHAGNRGASIEWENYRPIGPDFLQEYVTNGDDEGNIWVTAHGQAKSFLNGELMLRDECLYELPGSGSAAGCERAVLNGVASVGVPYSWPPLSQTINEYHYEDPCPLVPRSYFEYRVTGSAWWQQRILVFIADRSSFFRPSFVPSNFLPLLPLLPLLPSPGPSKFQLANKEIHQILSECLKDFESATLIC